MGKIMKDGIQYGVGGIQKAESITYDNTDSGMTATNVQGAVDEQASAISDLNTGLASFQIRKVNFSYSIAANSNTHGNLYTTINNDMPSGYRFLAFAGFNTASVNVFMSNMRYVNSDYSIELRNVSSTIVTQTSDIFYLCAKI